MDTSAIGLVDDLLYSAVVKQLSYWSSSVAVATVLGARGIVPVVCSLVQRVASDSRETL